MLIDTHVHLNNPKLYEDLDYYVDKAKQNKVEYMFVVGYSHETNQRAIAIAERYDFIYAIVGYHPTEAKDITRKDFEVLENLLHHKKVIGIGETGLDFYWDKEFQNAQIEVFEKHIELSKKYQKPLVIHMRDATDKTYQVLKKHAPVKGVMHCYSGSSEMAPLFIDLGLHISLGGPVTFKNARVPKEVAKIVPLDYLLIETDAPYLAPHPFRGKQNDSSLLPYIAEAIASIKKVSFDTIAEKTSKNALRLFRLKEENL